MKQRKLWEECLNAERKKVKYSRIIYRRKGFIKRGFIDSAEKHHVTKHSMYEPG